MEKQLTPITLTEWPPHIVFVAADYMETKKVKTVTTEEYLQPVQPVLTQTAPASTPQIVQIATPQNTEADALEELAASLDEHGTALEFLDSLPENAQATIIITRLPDALNQRGQWATPCTSAMKCDSFSWYGNTSTESDLHAAVSNTYGGGNYRFEVRAGRGFTGLSWKDTLADGREFLARREAEQRAAQAEEKARREAEQRAVALSAPVTTTPQPASFTQQLKEQTAQVAAMRDFMQLLQPAPQTQAATPAPLADNPFGLLQAAASSGNEKMFEIAAGLVKDNEPKRNWLETVIDFASEHPEQAQGLITMGASALGSVMASFVSALQPPATATAPARPRRRAVPPVHPSTPQPEPSAVPLNLTSRNQLPRSSRQPAPAPPTDENELV